MPFEIMFSLQDEIILQRPPYSTDTLDAKRAITTPNSKYFARNFSQKKNVDSPATVGPNSLASNRRQ